MCVKRERKLKERTHGSVEVGRGGGRLETEGSADVPAGIRRQSAGRTPLLGKGRPFSVRTSHWLKPTPTTP